MIDMLRKFFSDSCPARGSVVENYSTRNYPWMSHVFAVVLGCAAFLYPPKAAADELGRFKRNILRDCDEALSIYREQLTADPSLVQGHREEIVRYLAEVFRLNLVANLELPLSPGKLADPADIWRSLSGESDTNSKMCALRMVRELGVHGIGAADAAAALLSRETIPGELKRDIAHTLVQLFGLFPPGEGAVPAEIERTLGVLRDIAFSASSADPERSTAAKGASTLAAVLLVYGWDEQTVLNQGTPAAAVAKPQVAAGSGNVSMNVASSSMSSSTKARREFLRGLGAAEESRRSAVVQGLTAEDLRLLEGLRTAGSRTERVGAALALARLTTNWTLDTNTSRTVDCTFAESFTPWLLPKDLKRRDEVSRLVARCLLVGRDRFLAQVLRSPELLRSDALAAVLNERLRDSIPAGAFPSVHERVAILSLRVAAEPARTAWFERALDQLCSEN